MVPGPSAMRAPGNKGLQQNPDPLLPGEHMHSLYVGSDQSSSVFAFLFPLKLSVSEEQRL